MPDPAHPLAAFQVEDWENRPVYVAQDTFDRHKTKHLEIGDYMAEAIQAIRDPDTVTEAPSGAVKLCRFGLGRGNGKAAG